MQIFAFLKKGCKSFTFFSPLWLPSDPAGLDPRDGWGEDFKKKKKKVIFSLICMKDLGNFDYGH